MDEHTHYDLIDKIREISKKTEGVIDTEKCFVRKAGMQFHVDLHIIVNGQISVREGHNIAHKLQNVLGKEIPELSNILIHVEPNE